jgi:hypothetical protein
VGVRRLTAWAMARLRLSRASRRGGGGDAESDDTKVVVLSRASCSNSCLGIHATLWRNKADPHVRFLTACIYLLYAVTKEISSTLHAWLLKQKYQVRILAEILFNFWLPFSIIPEKWDKTWRQATTTPQTVSNSLCNNHLISALYEAGQLSRYRLRNDSPTQPPIQFVRGGGLSLR